jgi:site-specific DNA recombinase
VPENKQLRCAIYTRVSTDAGLEQDFNSLDAQREAAEAYIKSQAHEGWRLIRTTYDDGGYSGGTLGRPALERLLQDVRDRKVDVIVVYKVDRLTRSLADFAKLVDLFDQHAVSFVSVTQAFNTTTSMGRLTLNVLLSFAQFEREVTAERIRDKIAASKKKGIWVGGNVPFGYRVHDRKLLVDSAEAKLVRMIFQRYLALGSSLPLLEELHQKGVRTRKRRLSSGKETGGIPFARGSLNALLKNRIYVGEINHKGKSYPGEHEAIVDFRLFASVQEKLLNNTRRTRMARTSNEYMLEGLLYDDRGTRMSPTYTKKGGARYRYYVCKLLIHGRAEEAGSIRRVNAAEIEHVVSKAIQQYYKAKKILSAEQVRSQVLKVCIGTEKLDIDIAPQNGGKPFRIKVPWKPQTGRPKREIILPHKDRTLDDRPVRSETREHVVRALALGRTWLQELITDKTMSIDRLASREGRSRRSVQMLLSLNSLCPKIVRGLIAGQLPRGIGITKLVDLPVLWNEQFDTLGIVSTVNNAELKF